jgi:hypothetical protein
MWILLAKCAIATLKRNFAKPLRASDRQPFHMTDVAVRTESDQPTAPRILVPPSPSLANLQILPFSILVL